MEIELGLSKCKECGGRRYMEMLHQESNSLSNPCPDCVLELEQRIDSASKLLTEAISGDIFEIPDGGWNKVTKAIYILRGK